MAHPNYDEFWQARNLLPHLEAVGALGPAVMTVGGWFDAEDLYLVLHTPVGEVVADAGKIGAITFFSETVAPIGIEQKMVAGPKGFCDLAEVGYGEDLAWTCVGESDDRRGAEAGFEWCFINENLAAVEVPGSVHVRPTV